MTSEAPYQGLTPDVVLDAVESLGYLSDGRVLALNSYENRVYQVGVEDAEPVIVKFYRPNRWSDDQVLEEHQFSLELEAAGCPVVPPLEIAGSTLNSYTSVDSEFRLSVFARRGGRAPDLDNFETLFTMGQHLGRIHRVGSAKAFTYRPSLTYQSFAQDSVEFVLEHFIPNELRASYEGITNEVLPLLKARLDDCDERQIKWIRTHGDCHMGNVLWRDDRPNFVDLDDARMAPAIQDMWMLLSGDGPERVKQLLEIIEGYEEEHNFHRAEISLIEPLRTLRMLHHTAWLARRWHDPAFPMAFPWFNTANYWGEQILALREQMMALHEEPLQLHG